MMAEQVFRLGNRRGEGVFCGREGAFVGKTALLERTGAKNGRDFWQVRESAQLESELGKSYGFPVDFRSKLRGAETVARALNSGNLALAQIATLLLRLPDPPVQADRLTSIDEKIDLLRRMQINDLLKADWDPDKHPRWPARSTEGVGGQFAPADSGSDSSTSGPSPVSTRQSAIIPICIASGISVATDQYGNKLSSCNYECFDGSTFYRTYLGGGGCPPVLQPPQL